LPKRFINTFYLYINSPFSFCRAKKCFRASTASNSGPTEHGAFYSRFKLSGISLIILFTENYYFVIQIKRAYTRFFFASLSYFFFFFLHISTDNIYSLQSLVTNLYLITVDMFPASAALEKEFVALRARSHMLRNSVFLYPGYDSRACIEKGRLLFALFITYARCTRAMSLRGLAENNRVRRTSYAT